MSIQKRIDEQIKSRDKFLKVKKLEANAFRIQARIDEDIHIQEMIHKEIDKRVSFIANTKSGKKVKISIMIHFKETIRELKQLCGCKECK